MKRLVYHLAGIALVLDYCARVYVVSALAATIVFNTPISPRDLAGALFLVLWLQLRSDS